MKTHLSLIWTLFDPENITVKIWTLNSKIIYSRYFQNVCHVRTTRRVVERFFGVKLILLPFSNVFVPLQRWILFGNCVRSWSRCLWYGFNNVNFFSV